MLSKCSHVKSYLSFTFKCVFLYEPLPDFYTGTYPFPLLTLHVAYASGMAPPFSYYFKEYLDCKENTSQEHTALCEDQKKRSPDCVVSLQNHDCEHGFSPPPRVSHLLEQRHSALSPRGPRMATVNNQETL